jgi:osmoprotectant transport system substrate-binding protein
MIPPKRGIVALGVLIVSASLVLTGCSSSSSLSGSSSSSKSKTTIIVGNAGFSENVILADIYGQALAHGGYKITYKNAGDRTAYVPALKAGEINLIPDYTGSILDFLDNSATANSPSDVDAALAKALPSNLVALTPASAADSDTITVTSQFAKANNLKSIGDLKKLSSFTLGASQQFQTRPDGIKGLQTIYGLSNIQFTAINDGGGPATLKALLANTIQAADIYSTTPSIVENKLVSLKDPKSLFASQEIVPIITKKLATSAVRGILNKVDSKLTTKSLLELNEEVQGASKTDPAVAATKWLKANGLL